MAVAPPPQTPLPRAYVLLSGLAMGAADVVPGVSGGSMAFILGIYSTLLEAIQDPEVQEPEGESKDGLQDKSTRQVSDRWEFPEKILFGRTDFIAGKLENLEHVDAELRRGRLH